jgi:hypothetical protein
MWEKKSATSTMTMKLDGFGRGMDYGAHWGGPQQRVCAERTQNVETRSRMISSAIWEKKRCDVDMKHAIDSGKISMD